MSFHPECECIQTDYRQKGIHGRLGGSEINVMFPPHLVEIGQWSLPVDKRFKVRKPFFRPGKIAAVNHHSSHGSAVPAEKLCGGMDDHIGPQFNGSA